MFKKLTPLDKLNVVYCIETDEISFMSEYKNEQISIIINPNTPKSHTLIQLKNGQALTVLETIDEILAIETVH